MAERRIMTVLFADVVGFTGLSEAFDPEDVATLQSAYFDAVRQTLERYGGVVEKFIGDAAVALFGAPRAREDDAQRAVRAALALTAAVSGLAGELGLEPDTFQLRVGVNTGEVAFDPDELRATGDTVNVAARLESTAPPGGVLIGADTALAVADVFELDRVGEVDVKGRSEPVHVWQVGGVRARPSREAALGRLGRGGIVGRDQEIEQLMHDLEGLSAPCWTLLVAPPGAGKSRLVAEFLRRLEAHPAQAWTVRCEPEPAHPFAPIGALLDQALTASGIGATLSPAARGDALASCLRAAHVAAPEQLATHAVELLAGETGVTTEDRETRFGAWLTAFGVLEADSRCVWLLEDVHNASQDALAFLTAALAVDAPRSVVMTARPELLGTDPTWQEREDSGRLVLLPPLQPSDTAALVAQLTGGGLPDRLVQRIAEASGGNPLFVEELLRTWVALGTLAERPDGFVLTTPVEDLHIPTTVQSLYAAQLDDLPAEARATAQRGAVVGQRFAVPALEALLEAPAAPGLEPLEARSLVDGPDEAPLGPEWAYRHALLRDTAYLTVSRAARAHLHARLATWLEERADARQHSELIAHHLRTALRSAPALLAAFDDQPRSEVRDRAVRWTIEAGRSALATGAYDSARQHAQELLQLDPEPLARAEGLELDGAASSATDLAAGTDRLAEAAAAYEAIMTVPGPDQQAAAEGYARTSLRLARLRYDQLRFDDTVAIARGALHAVGALLPEEELLGLRVWMVRGAASMADVAGLAELEPTIDELVAAARRGTDENVLFDALDLLFEYGDLERDVRNAVLEEQAQRAEQLGRWRDVLVQRRLINGQLLQLDPPDALARGRELPPLARSFGLTESEAFATYGVVEAALAAGEWDEAVEAGVRALDLAERHHVNRAYVRTSFALMPIAVARDERPLVARMIEAHERLHADLPSLSSYARVVVTGVRLYAGRPALEDDAPAADDLMVFFPGSPSAAAQAEVCLWHWLADGRGEEVLTILDRAREQAGDVLDEPTLGASSWHLVRAWALRAIGSVEAAEDAARGAIERAAACSAPWWEARALRTLEGLGAGDDVLTDRRVRIEGMLGVVVPQPPPG